MEILCLDTTTTVITYAAPSLVGHSLSVPTIAFVANTHMEKATWAAMSVAAAMSRKAMASSLDQSELKARSSLQSQPRTYLASKPLESMANRAFHNSLGINTKRWVPNVNQVLRYLAAQPAARWRTCGNMSKQFFVTTHPQMLACQALNLTAMTLTTALPAFAQVLTGPTTLKPSSTDTRLSLV